MGERALRTAERELVNQPWLGRHDHDRVRGTGGRPAGGGAAGVGRGEPQADPEGQPVDLADAVGVDVDTTVVVGGGGRAVQVGPEVDLGDRALQGLERGATSLDALEDDGARGGRVAVAAVRLPGVVLGRCVALAGVILDSAVRLAGVILHAAVGLNGGHGERAAGRIAGEIDGARLVAVVVLVRGEGHFITHEIVDGTGARLVAGGAREALP